MRAGGDSAPRARQIRAALAHGIAPRAHLFSPATVIGSLHPRPTLRSRHGRARLGLLLLGVAAALVAVRWAVPRVLASRAAHDGHGPAAAIVGAPPALPARLSEYLRNLAAAEEQFRLAHRHYTAALDSLALWLPLETDLRPQLRVKGGEGLSARIASAGVTCALWIRDPALRDSLAPVEGAPACDVAIRRAPESAVHAVPFAAVRERGLRATDLGGSWPQHRGDPARSGSARPDEARSGAFRWTAHVNGELKAPVAIGGNQLWVGAHGNGELAVLTLDSGRTAFRLRAPNWIHHEPALTPSLAIIGFGNNENAQLPPPFFGSAPSGLVAYDRRTGAERWRIVTPSTVMTTPVVAGTLAIAIVDTEAVAWRLTDGAEQWRTALPSGAPMGNALLVDSTIYIGLEKATLCALRARTGARIFCTAYPTRGWGAGHASVALAHDAILLSFEQGVSIARLWRTRRHRAALRAILGIPSSEYLGEQVLLAVDATTGVERWRTPLGVGGIRPVGHVAGTPVVDDSTAVVSSPVNGRIVSVGITDGRVRWSAAINSARGAVLMAEGAILAATRDSAVVVLDAVTGAKRCRVRLSAASDRAGPTRAGETAILTLSDGTVLARPLADWLNCRM